MKIAIIGGSGLYNIEGFKIKNEVAIETPFGKPSDKLIVGEINGTELVFLPRHNRDHNIMPSELNHRANIYALKKFGIGTIFSISAVGSLQENIAPCDVVIPDQYFDRTKSKNHTFFGDGIVAHVPMAEPVCKELANIAEDAVTLAVRQTQSKIKVHRNGTYVNMEGPAFSTKAESNVYRQLGMDIIGMTNMAEAKLAREAEICYTTIAMVTDYDCWHPDHDNVTVDLVIANLLSNVAISQNIIKNIVELTKNSTQLVCKCREALSCAIITKEEAVTTDIRERLAPIISKYFPMQ
ncbi:S-methyl-5'-thioadenosine phosphorylase [Lentisphaerota bacterium WC36G]|nr:S-methyl-5'-thioadenosine phosphorylase [Lentisphaerae bacterium WC36]